jgi:hypothetical protein
MLERNGKEVHSVRKSLVHLCLIAAPLLWPLILIYKDTIRPSLPSLAGRYWAALSLASIERWCFRVFPSALPVLGLIVATLVILREQM